MTELEEFLAKEYNKKYCVFTGGGTSAMYLAFQMLGLGDKKVLFPSISCVNPVNAALYSGYKVDFCDIDHLRFTLDLDMTEKMLSSGKYGILVPTHIYGHRENMVAIKQICDRYEVRIVEDCAQTVSVLGDDLSIVSFGHTKIFECEDGGGAVFCDNPDTYLQLKALKRYLSPKSDDYQEKVEKYREEYYFIMNGPGNRSEKLKKIGYLQKEMKNNDIFDISDNDEVLNVIKEKDRIIKDRIRKKKLYDDLLVNDAIVKPQIDSEEVVWRYTFLYTKDRAKLLKLAREKHIDISTWYPSLSMIYNGYDHMNAKMVEEQVVNLWVDDSHTDEQIKEEIAILNEIMEKDNGME